MHALPANATRRGSRRAIVASCSLSLALLLTFLFVQPCFAAEAKSTNYAAAGYGWENNSLGTGDTLPKGFSGIQHTPSSQTTIDDRIYRLQDSLLPTQLGLKNLTFISSPIELELQFDGEGTGPTSFNSEIIESTKSTLVIRNTEQTNKLQKIVTLTVDFDGFIKIDVALQPFAPINIDKLALNVNLYAALVTHYERHLSYNFDSQIVNRDDLLLSKGSIDDIGALAFTPSIWIGSAEAGIEYLSETNAHYSLRNSTDAFNLVANNSVYTLTNTLINQRTQISGEYKFSIGLLVTPVIRTKNSNRKSILTSSLRNTIGVNDLDLIHIGHWKRDDFALPGIPVPSYTNGIVSSIYSTNRQSLEDIGARYLPYAALHLMPTTLPELSDFRNEWSAAPARNGSIYWAEKIGETDPIQPVSLESKSIQDYIIHTHTNELLRNKIGGVYFDVSTPRELESTTARYISNNQTNLYNTRPVLYYPTFQYREFLKRYWKATKLIDDDFLILHHGTYLPRFAESFVDMKVYGEGIHNLFKKGDVYPEKIEVAGSTTLVFSDPKLYIPDYLSLPENILPGMEYARSPTTRVILPQVLKFNRDYLDDNPELYQQWTRGLLGQWLITDQRIWNSRLHAPTLKAVWEWLDGFNNFVDANHKRVIDGLPDGVNLSVYAASDEIVFVFTNSNEYDLTIDASMILKVNEITSLYGEPENPGQTIRMDELIIPAKDILMGRATTEDRIYADSTGGGGSGCSISNNQLPFDPVLPAMLLMSLAWFTRKMPIRLTASSNANSGTSMQSKASGCR